MGNCFSSREQRKTNIDMSRVTHSPNTVRRTREITYTTPVWTEIDSLKNGSISALKLAELIKNLDTKIAEYAASNIARKGEIEAHIANLLFCVENKNQSQNVQTIHSKINNTGQLEKNVSEIYQGLRLDKALQQKQ